MGSMSDTASPIVDSAPLAPFRVLVVGGSYGGLSAALNLQDLCSGRAPRCGEPPKEGEPPAESFQVAVDITVVDERDGFCKLLSGFLLLTLRYRYLIESIHLILFTNEMQQ